MSVAARQATCSLTSNLCLPGQDPEGSVNGSEVGDEIRAGVPADRAVDQFTDQFSPGNTRRLRHPIQRVCLAFGEVDIGPLHTSHHTPLLR